MTMQRNSDRSDEVRRLDQAAEWLLRLQGEPDSTEVITEWVEWCEADPRNQRSFDRVQELMQLSGGLATEVAGGELLNGRSSAESESTLVDFPGAFTRSPRAPWAAACAIALLISLGMWMAFDPPSWWPVRNGSVIASHEPLRAAKLPDGSRVELAAKSTVAVRYTDDARMLELQGGEAYFAVQPNKERPFIVEAGGLQVRAVGTAFNVRRSGQRVVVTVTEGTVDIKQEPGGAGAGGVRVAAGDQYAWSAQDGISAITTVDPAAALAWREGRLEYTGEPLEAVIADINRYTPHPVVVVDDAARSLRFSGTVLVDYTHEWVQALPSEFPVRVREENGVAVIQSVL